MHRGTWKAKERKVAGFFGSKRTSLSGGNSKITRSDTMHEHLFIEVKHRKTSSVWKLFEQTKEMAKAEGKTPVVALGLLNHEGVLFVIHSNDLAKVLQELSK